MADPVGLRVRTKTTSPHPVVVTIEPALPPSCQHHPMEKEIATDDDAHEHVKSAAPTAVSYGWPAGMKGKPKLIKRDNTINPKVIQNAAKEMQVVVKNEMVESGEKEKVFSLTYSVLQKTVPLRNV